MLSLKRFHAEAFIRIMPQRFGRQVIDFYPLHLSVVESKVLWSPRQECGSYLRYSLRRLCMLSSVLSVFFISVATLRPR